MMVSHLLPSTLRRAVCSLFALALLTGTATHAQQFDHDEVIVERFDARPGQTLFVDAAMGTLDVVGRRGNAVEVRVVKGANDVDAGRARALFDAYTVEIRETDGGIEVRGRYDRPRRWRRNPLQVRYEITVPERYDVDLETSGGSIRVAGIDGTAEVETSGGSLTLNDVGGPVEARTSGGSISAEGLGAHADLRTSGGSITVRGVGGPLSARTSGGSIRVASTDGDVEARTSGGSITLTDIAGAVSARTSGGSVEAEVVGQPQRDMVLETSGGSVRLRLDPAVRADIAARASGGRVRSDVPVAVRGEIKPDRLEGRLNGGGPLITLQSSGGGVYIERR